MKRKHTYENLKVVDIDISHGEFLIAWQCEGIGFGEYTINEDRDGIYLASEHMDNNSDKAFLQTLLEALFEYLNEHAEVVE